MKFRIALSIAALACCKGSASTPATTTPPVDQVVLDAQAMIEEGRQTFRSETFGDEDFWGGTIGLHKALEGAAKGGVGAGVSPKTALSVGLKVDVDVLPQTIKDGIVSGAVNLDDPATTLALLDLDAVVGVKGFSDGNGALKSVGISCALCHTNVDNSFAPGIGHRLDGWPNRDLNVGAVINAKAQRRILEYVGIGKKEGRIVAGGTAGPKQGYFVMPTVVDGVKPSARLACEEIFGPVLSVLKVKSFDEGIAVANMSEYGLTGALYSRERERLLRGKRELFVGNLYLNRKCTGALVGVHPFGGFNMSGTDSKAGGRDYLNLFTQQKAISEKL